MTWAAVKVLPVPVAPSSAWNALAVAEALDELLDGLRLVAGRLELADELELGGHGPAPR